MTKHTILSMLALVCLLLASCGGSGGGDAAESVITSERLLTHVQALSADEMLGRAPGTPGEEIAVDYIAGFFESLGLSQVNGSYLQDVRLVGTKRDSESSSFSISSAAGDLPLVDGQNATFWSSSQRDVVSIEDAPLVFVGYGVQAPEHEWDDFKGQDMHGKVLLFLNNDPPVTEDGMELFGGEARTYYGRWTYKFEQAMKLGAAGALMIHTTPSASYPFSVVQHNGTDEHFALDLPGTGYQVDLLGWLDEEISGQIASSMNTDLAGLFELAMSRDFAPTDTGFRVNTTIKTDIRKITTKNVLGVVEGTDPSLADQYIVFSAHYDHLGTNEDLEGPDKIFNGAWDNAAGTAAIMVLAEAFAKSSQKPARSLLFLACAAEESGSLGSRWFVNDPGFPRQRLVANLNVDMPQVLGVTADIGAIGVDTNSLGRVLQEVASETIVTRVDGTESRIRVTGDPNPNAGSFYRSDQVNFAKAGIPALFLQPGSDWIPPLDFDPGAYKDSHYHQLIDQVDEKWNLSGLARDMQVLFEVARRVGNDPEMPRWNPGNEFESVWGELHGKAP